MNLESERIRFTIAFVSTLALVLGLLSAILTMLGRHLTLGACCASVLVSVLASAGIHFGRLRKHQISPGVLATATLQGSKRICCPCSIQQSKEVAVLARSCFGSETVSPERYEQFRVKNPYILSCLAGANGDFLGYFDVIPLDQSFGTMFISGQLGEKDLTHEHVLTPSAMGQAQFVYFSGIAASHASTMKGMLNGSILVWASLKYLLRYYGQTRTTLFASAVTEEGEQLLKHLGFQLRGTAASRRDHHSLYSATLSAETISQQLRIIPDFSPLVNLPWDFSPADNIQPRHRRRGVPPSRPLRPSSILVVEDDRSQARQ